MGEIGFAGGMDLEEDAETLQSKNLRQYVTQHPMRAYAKNKK
jgi:hypothetical protein